MLIAGQIVNIIIPPQCILRPGPPPVSAFLQVGSSSPPHVCVDCSPRLSQTRSTAHRKMAWQCASAPRHMVACHMEAQGSPYNCGQMRSVSLMKTGIQKTVQPFWAEQGRTKLLPTEETRTKTTTKAALRVLQSMDRMAAVTHPDLPSCGTRAILQRDNHCCTFCSDLSEVGRL